MYSPRLSNEQVKILYCLSQKTRKPMTELVREAVDLYLKKWGTGAYTKTIPKTPMRR